MDIVLDIKKKKVILSVSEAKALRDELNEVFPVEVQEKAIFFSGDLNGKDYERYSHIPSDVPHFLRRQS